MTDPQRLARVFKVLASDSRVRILQLLKKRVLCVEALANRLAITPAAVSQHLRILRDADLVTSDKRGYHVHYRVNKKTLARWQKMADQLLGMGAE